MKVRRSIWIALFITIAFALFVSTIFVDRVPTASLTDCAMHMCKRRILRYAASHNALPQKLTQIAEIQGYYNSINDAWGHEIIYIVEANGDVRLMSLGKDNKIGGENDDADMIGIFPSKTADGRWSDEFVEWKQDPFEQFKKQRQTKVLPVQK